MIDFNTVSVNALNSGNNPVTLADLGVTILPQTAFDLVCPVGYETAATALDAAGDSHSSLYAAIHANPPTLRLIVGGPKSRPRA